MGDLTGDLKGNATAQRVAQFERLRTQGPWDVLVIGGGATGLGIALDAAARGYSVALVEQWDFAKGTSSRATKLLHGGVRYLAQGNIKLVREALHERAVILRNAPHLAQRLAFVIPVYSRWRQWQYGLGLTAYSWLAGAQSLGKTEWLSAAETVAALPTVRQAGLVGGIRYWDAQFDDARLALALATTAAHEGAVLLNYCAVEQLVHDAQGQVAGAICRDAETGLQTTVAARCVVNATGVWVDEICRQDRPAGVPASANDRGRVQPSRGAHVVLDPSFLPSDAALMVPATSDGRVLFAIPWHGQLLAGTTDVPADANSADPVPTPDEIRFILTELGQYLTRPPQVADIRSQWAGLRPLVRPDTEGAATQGISREHEIWVRPSGLVSVTGGKWTTYRVIAEDTLRECQKRGLLGLGQTPRTADLPLHPVPHGPDGSAAAIDRLPGADATLAPGLTEAMVRYAVRHEYARTVDDVLARRSRLLFLDAAAALRCAPRVAELLQEEGCPAPALDAFRVLAAQYAVRA